MLEFKELGDENDREHRQQPGGRGIEIKSVESAEPFALESADARDDEDGRIKQNPQARASHRQSGGEAMSGILLSEKRIGEAHQRQKSEQFGDAAQEPAERISPVRIAVALGAMDEEKGAETRKAKDGDDAHDEEGLPIHR